RGRSRSASLRLLEEVGEDGAAGFDRIRDRDREAGQLRMRGEVGVRGLVSLEEVEDIAAAAEAGPVAAGAASEHDRGCWFPPGALAGIETDPDLAAAERVVRGDLDRLLEHRGDSERVDRAHRLDAMRAVDQH